LNEEAAKVTGLESPLGKTFSAWGFEGRIPDCRNPDASGWTRCGMNETR